MKKSKLIAWALSLAMVVTSVTAPSNSAEAAKKPSIAKKVAVEVGKTVTVKVKNANKKTNVKFALDKKAKGIVKLGKQVKKGAKASVKVTGVKEGTGKLTATIKNGKKKVATSKCTITVKDASTNNTSAAPAATSPATTSASASTAPTGSAAPTATTAAGENAEKTTKPSKAPTPKPTKAPTPSPRPVLVNPYSVDLSDASLYVGDGLPGAEGTVAYNAETGTLDSQMKGIQGFIVKNSATTDIQKYKYVEICYSLGVGGTLTVDGEETEDKGGDVNLYLGDADISGFGTGQEAAGWSNEIKLNEFAMGDDTEVTVTYGVDSLFGKENDYIKAVKFFNFGSDTLIKIKSITYYMDGNKEEQKPYVATKNNSEIIIDGVAEETSWAKANEYNFISIVSLDGGIVPCESAAKAKFMYDADNMYFFVKVTDPNIDASNQNNFERDGLEVLFDEDNCKKEGANSADWGTVNKDGFHFRATGLDPKSTEKTNLTPSTAAIQGGGEEGKAKEGIEVKYALTSTGYTMEGKIPFTTKKVGGEKVAMDLIVQDCKGGVRSNEVYLTKTAEAKVYWNNESAAFATIELEASGD